MVLATGRTSNKQVQGGGKTRFAREIFSMSDKETNTFCQVHSQTAALILGHLWYSLVALLIPGLSIDPIARYLPSIGHILTNLLRVAVPLTPLTVRLRCEAHCVLLTYGRIFQDAEYHIAPTSYRRRCRISVQSVSSVAVQQQVQKTIYKTVLRMILVHTCGICTCCMGLTISVVSLPQ